MITMKRLCAFSAVLMFATVAQGATIFGATYDSSKTADIAAGNPVPIVAGLSSINNASSKFGAGSLDTSGVTSGGNGTKYATASNFNPLAGTVDFWMQLPNGYDGTRQDLFSIFAGGFTGDFSLYIDPGTQRLQTVVDVAGANQWSQGGFVNAFSVLGDGQWHHIAWEWDTNAGFATLYVDGVPENFSVIGTVSFAGGTLGNDMEIGSRQGGFDNFKGNIDDLRISNSAIFGQVAFTPPTQSTVPEPATLGVMGMGLMMLVRRK
jgi:hypothetical protein